MRKIAFIMLAKGKSNRLPKKNKLLFEGKQMFVWNLVKAMKISKRFYSRIDPQKPLPALIIRTKNLKLD